MWGLGDWGLGIGNWELGESKSNFPFPSKLMCIKYCIISDPASPTYPTSPECNLNADQLTIPDSQFPIPDSPFPPTPLATVVQASGELHQHRLHWEPSLNIVPNPEKLLMHSLVGNKAAPDPSVLWHYQETTAKCAQPPLELW